MPFCWCLPWPPADECGCGVPRCLPPPPLPPPPPPPEARAARAAEAAAAVAATRALSGVLRRSVGLGADAQRSACLPAAVCGAPVGVNSSMLLSAQRTLQPERKGKTESQSRSCNLVQKHTRNAPLGASGRGPRRSGRRCSSRIASGASRGRRGRGRARGGAVRRQRRPGRGVLTGGRECRARRERNAVSGRGATAR